MAPRKNIKRRSAILTVLRKTLKKILDPDTHFKWHKMHACNCGIMAQVALDKSPQQISRLVSQIGAWSDCPVYAYTKYCKNTGLDIAEILKALFDIGFTGKEISDFETLKNEEILKLAGITPFYDCKKGSYYTKKENVILYLKAWIKIETKKLNLQKKNT